jgi:formylglycine-generating enzyme required for sulfatase activity
LSALAAAFILKGLPHPYEEASMSRTLRRMLPTLPPVALAFVLALPMAGQPDKAKKGKKYAVLVGVNHYEHDKLPPLKYAENDVVALGAILAKHEYEVTLLTAADGAKKPDRLPTKANIDAHIKRVLDKFRRGDLAVVALAGHGLQFEGKPDAFFCPSDARPFPDKTDTLVSLAQIHEEMKKSFAGVKLLLVDACRNDPKASRGARGVDGDNAPRPPSGVGSLFSCSAGQRAFEDDKLKHGVFFHFVLRGLQGAARNEQNEVTWGRLAEYVSDKVSLTVPVLIGDGARQEPNEVKNLSGRSPVLVTLPAVVKATPSPDKDKGPKPPKDKGPKEPGNDISSEFDDPPPQKEPDRIKLEAVPEFTNTVGMTLKLIRGGGFTMGAPAGESENDDEKQHEEQIKRDYYLAIHVVTQKQFKEVMGHNPSYFSEGGEGRARVKRRNTDDLPVETVSWQDANTFCNTLSAREGERTKGRKYRLPTEAEWEFACRAGTTTAFHFGNKLSVDDANFNERHKGTTPVGKFKPNRLGLFDLHGNVRQWCRDLYAFDYKNPRGQSPPRVVRGGSWRDGAADCRSANRLSLNPDNRVNYVGFRVACDAPR